MLQNYLKIALRNLLKYRLYSFINIAGLAMGMACCLLMLLYVQDELSFDRFHKKADRIYRLTLKSTLTGSEHRYSRTPVPIAPLLKNDFPEVEAVARLYSRSAGMQTVGENGFPSSDKHFEERRFFFADSTVFSIFTIPFVKGNPQKALTQPGSVVITEEMAAKYFDHSEPLGRTLLFEGKLPLKVTGVVHALPDNSHFQFDFLATFDDMFAVEEKGTGDFLRSNWLFGPLSTYVLLAPGQPVEHVESRFPEFLKRHVDDRAATGAPSGGINVAKSTVLHLQPLGQIHLYSDYMDDDQHNAITYVYISAIIAILTLLIACINFINLSTARSLSRAREVGMRKVLGAQRMQIIRQFLAESLLISFFAFLLSLALTELFLPLVNSVTDKHLTLLANGHPQMMMLFIGVFLLTGLIAGSYPAFFVSRFRPTITLKGQTTENVSRNGLLRKVLVIAQFTISLVLIAGALIVYSQLQYLRSKPLGFQKEHIINIPIFSENTNSILGGGVTGVMRKKMNTFEDVLRGYSNIDGVTVSSTLPGFGSVLTLVIPEGKTNQDNLFASWLAVDYDFATLYGLKFVAGRSFSKATGRDHLEAFILNESAVRSFGWKSPQDALGKTFARGDAVGGKQGKVIGVVKDFHVEPLHTSIGPLVMDVFPPVFNNFSVKIRSSHVPETVEFLKKQWAEFFPDRVFEYSFLDDDLNRLYRSEERLGTIVGYFATLAIIISGLGLFGLALFTTAQRTKEIGVRKVLGASIREIIVLLLKDFTLLVGIAIILAIPLTLIAAHRWLREFAYRVDVSVWIFVFASTLVFIIALLTVGYQAFQAARTNPVNALRYE